MEELIKQLFVAIEENRVAKEAAFLRKIEALIEEKLSHTGASSIPAEGGGELLTKAEVAKFAKCSEWLVGQRVRAGLLPCLRNGRRTLYRKEDVVKLFKQVVPAHERAFLSSRQ